MNANRFSNLRIEKGDIEKWTNEAASMMWGMPHICEFRGVRVAVFLAIQVIVDWLFTRDAQIMVGDAPVFPTFLIATISWFGLFGVGGGTLLRLFLRRRYRALSLLLAEVRSYNRSIDSFHSRLALSNRLDQIQGSKATSNSDPKATSTEHLTEHERETQVYEAFSSTRDELERALRIEHEFRKSGVGSEYQPDFEGILATATSTLDERARSFGSEFREATEIGMRVKEIFNQLDGRSS